MVIRPSFIFGDDVGSLKSEDIFEANKTKLNYKSREKSMNEYYYMGALAAFICMFSYAIFGIIVRYLQQNIEYKSPEVFLFYHGFYCIVISVIMYAFEKNGLTWFLQQHFEQYDAMRCLFLLIFGMIGAAQNYVRFKSRLLVGPVALGFLQASEIIVSYLIQVILFHTIPDLTTVLGAIFIMIACTGILLEKRLSDGLPKKLQKIF